MTPSKSQEFRSHEKLAILTHSCQTAIAMDIVGHAFDQSWPTARNGWFPLTKKQCQRWKLPAIEGRDMPKPGYPMGGKVYGQCGSNSTIMQSVMRTLSDFYPTQQVDVAETILACMLEAKKLRESDQEDPVDKYVEHYRRPQVDNGLAVPIGLGLAYYSATVDLGLDVVGTLSRGVAGAFGLPSSQIRTALAIAMLGWSLSETGYFCADDIEMLIEFDALSSDAAEVAKSLRDNALSTQYFDQFWTVEAFPQFYALPHSERALLRTLFFMLRISTQYKEEHIYFSTVPKENLPEVFEDVELGTDTGFLFGGLVTLSEQTGENGCYKLLIPENLVTDSPYAEGIHDLFKEIKGV